MSAPATRRLVTFGIGTAWYAVDVGSVERVLRFEGVFPVPGMPASMAGILEYHGRVIPVLDLRKCLGLPGEGATNSGRLLVLVSKNEVVAAAVDRVVDVRPIAVADLAPPPALVRDASGDFLVGVVRRDDAMVFVLDADRLMTIGAPIDFDVRAAESALATATSDVAAAGAGDGLDD